jgi:hypothetical protein
MMCDRHLGICKAPSVARCIRRLRLLAPRYPQIRSIIQKTLHGADKMIFGGFTGLPSRSSTIGGLIDVLASLHCLYFFPCRTELSNAGSIERSLNLEIDISALGKEPGPRLYRWHGKMLEHSRG